MRRSRAPSSALVGVLLALTSLAVTSGDVTAVSSRRSPCSQCPCRTARRAGSRRGSAALPTPRHTGPPHTTIVPSRSEPGALWHGVVTPTIRQRPCLPTPSRAAVRPALTHALQRDDRDHPVGLRLVVAERRHRLDLLRVEPVALLAGQDDGPGIVRLVADLDRHRRIGD